jgi:spore coat polysaccharide biosynthesis protein SpsF (cytidylyltransferase family)
MDGIVFIARLGSTRLSQKHLIKVLDKTFIEWLIKRFADFFASEITDKKIQLVLATSDEPENREFEFVLNSLPVEIFYGSVNNIPLRLTECAKKYDLKNVISIDGDDILCSTAATKIVLGELRKTMHEKWIKTTGLALGMNVAGYKRSVLEKSTEQIGAGKLETGWGRIFDSFESATINLGEYDQKTDLRFTLDYQEDANFFKSIIEGLCDKVLDASDQELIDYVIKNELVKINKNINEKYWRNFNSQMKAEG